MPQLEKIQHSFQRSLASYDQHAYVQADNAKQLNAFLVQEMIKQGDALAFNKIFEIGCGTGFLSRHLLENFQVDNFIGNDLVNECEQLFASLAQQSNAQFLEGDIKSVDLPNSLDLVCSASVLQWIENLSVLLEKLSQAMNAGAWLAVSSFGPAHFAELRTVQVKLNQSYSPLNYLDELQWHEKLNNNFDVKLTKSVSRTEWFDSVDAILKHLRKTGVNGNARQQWTPMKMREFRDTYEELYAENGKVPLTYEPVYIVAKKKEA